MQAFFSIEQLGLNLTQGCTVHVTITESYLSLHLEPHPNPTHTHTHTHTLTHSHTHNNLSVAINFNYVVSKAPLWLLFSEKMVMKQISYLLIRRPIDRS